MKVIITGPLTDEGRKVVAKEFPPECEVVEGGGLLEAELLEAAKTADVLVVPPFSVEMIEVAKNLKLVQNLGHGVEQQMAEPVKSMLMQRGIKVCKGGGSDACMAEYIIMAMVLLGRRYLRFHEALAYHGDDMHSVRSKFFEGSMGMQLADRTLGILGMGSIGGALAKRVKPMEMRVLGIKRNPEPEMKAELGLDSLGGMGDLKSVLSESDYVAICLPLTSETKGLMGPEEFAAMKDGSIIINVGRGDIIQERALFEALRSRKLGGAAIDVWYQREVEGGTKYMGEYPCLYPIHQYNVLMTPHISGLMRERRWRSLRTAGENVRRLMRGEERLVYEANFELGY